MGPNDRNDSTTATRDYLDHHQLQQRIQSLIQDVLREQPADPYRCMLEQLKKGRDQNNKPSVDQPSQPPKAAQEELTSAAPNKEEEPSHSISEAPLVPRPPEGPPPAKGGRPPMKNPQVQMQVEKTEKWSTGKQI